MNASTSHFSVELERIRSLDEEVQFIERLVSNGGPRPEDYPALTDWFQRVVNSAAMEKFTPADRLRLLEAFGEAMSPETLQGRGRWRRTPRRASGRLPGGAAGPRLSARAHLPAGSGARCLGGAARRGGCRGAPAGADAATRRRAHGPHSAGARLVHLHLAHLVGKYQWVAALTARLTGGASSPRITWRWTSASWRSASGGARLVHHRSPDVRASSTGTSPFGLREAHPGEHLRCRSATRSHHLCGNGSGPLRSCRCGGAVSSGATSFSVVFSPGSREG